jgi:hypothetical protein
MSNSTSATAAASSSATAAAVNNSDSGSKAEPKEEGVSDDLAVVSSDTTDSDDDNNNVDINKDDVNDLFFCAAQDIQNRTSWNVGTVAMEDRRFRELFGASIGIVLRVWHMMEDGGLLPKKTKPKHLLWTFYFMKVYPREAPAWSIVGGSGGVVDPKTLRKCALRSWRRMW